MFTYTGQATLFGTLTNNNSAANITGATSFASIFINQYTLELVHRFPSIFSEDTFTLQTYPNQQFYTLPNRLRKINTVVINVGNAGSATPTTVTGAGFNWPVQECPTLEYWNELNMTNNITSDIPLYYFFYNNQVGIYPKPAGGYNPITIRGQVEVTSISQSDDTSTTISSVPLAQTLTVAPAAGATSATLNSSWTLPTNTYQMVFTETASSTTQEIILVTLTNGSTAVTWSETLGNACNAAVTVRTSGGGDIVTGAGTAFTAAMVGYGLNIAQTTGDGYWYTIGTYYSATQVALTQAYAGTAITGATASATIGQISIIPAAYQLTPVYRACETYYNIISKDESRSKKYKELADNLMEAMEVDYGDKTTDPTVHDDFGTSIVNPNLAINTTQSTGL